MKAETLREKVERCRRLAQATTDKIVQRKLLELAEEYAATAAKANCSGGDTKTGDRMPLTPGAQRRRDPRR